jgi:hypothetical protein
MLALSNLRSTTGAMNALGQRLATKYRVQSSPVLKKPVKSGIIA